ncbi:MAG: hypothetical protein F6K40_06090 [Okeania sp. SIO3I5]|uniref:hypothetical protein n=1 Tax=Okeania sp. SIO3I5 TaxID=2607805 RepID=UPI0013B66312|nr:hypothetical protein [Okeania sp. SIO3I5]
MKLGDTLFYLSALADELGFSLDDIACINLEKLIERSEARINAGQAKRLESSSDD